MPFVVVEGWFPFSASFLFFWRRRIVYTIAATPATPAMMPTTPILRLTLLRLLAMVSDALPSGGYLGVVPSMMVLVFLGYRK